MAKIKLLTGSFYKEKVDDSKVGFGYNSYKLKLSPVLSKMLETFYDSSLGICFVEIEGCYCIIAIPLNLLMIPNIYSDEKCKEVFNTATTKKLKLDLSDWEFNRISEDPTLNHKYIKNNIEIEFVLNNISDVLTIITYHCKFKLPDSSYNKKEFVDKYTGTYSLVNKKLGIDIPEFSIMSNNTYGIWYNLYVLFPDMIYNYEGPYKRPDDEKVSLVRNLFALKIITDEINL